MSMLIMMYRISTTFQSLGSLRYTPHLQESCRILIETAEYPGDIQLAYMVKMQHIIGKIGRVIHGNDWDDSSMPKAPVALHVQSFHSELVCFKESLPLSLKQNGQYNSILEWRPSFPRLVGMNWS